MSFRTRQEIYVAALNGTTPLKELLAAIQDARNDMALELRQEHAENIGRQFQADARRLEKAQAFYAGIGLTLVGSA